MYELIILSLLMRGPLHGYMIAKITNEMIGPLARVSNGTLYPLLTKLKQSGLITTQEVSHQQRGKRQLYTFTITELGRDRFHQLMMDTTSNPGEYQKFFRFKVPHLELLSSEEHLYLLDHYINYCQAHTLHLYAESKNLIRENTEMHFMSPTQLASTLNMMQHIAGQWQTELDWVKSLRDQAISFVQT